MQTPADTNQRYAALRNDLAGAVRRTCPSWLRDRQDDLIQVAVLKVMDVEKKSEGDRQLRSSYLYRVAYSAMIDEIRRIRRRGEVGIDSEEDGLVVEPASPATTPEQNSVATQQGGAIRECLSRLAAARRQAVTLYLAGNTVPQSAAVLQWTVKRTENLVYRGLADLRACLQRKGIQP